MDDSVILGRVDRANARAAKEKLRVFSETSADTGLSDGEILVALAEGRDSLDPFGMICRFIGTVMRYLGPWITAVIVGISAVLFVRFVCSKIQQVGVWLKDVLSNIPFVSSGLRALGILDNNAKDAYNDAASGLAGVALSAAIEGAFPALVWKPLNAVVDQLTGPEAAATQQPSMIPSALGAAIGAARTQPTLATQVASGLAGGAGSAVGSAIDKVLSLFGKDGDVEFTNEELQSLAQLTGRDPREVAERLGRG